MSTFYSSESSSSTCFPGRATFLTVYDGLTVHYHVIKCQCARWFFSELHRICIEIYLKQFFQRNYIDIYVFHYMSIFNTRNRQWLLDMNWELLHFSLDLLTLLRNPKSPIGESIYPIRIKIPNWGHLL